MIWIVVLLVVTGVLCIATRIKILHRSYLPHGESVWRLTYDIDFQTMKGGKTHIAIPDNTPGTRVFHETFTHQKIWMDILRSKKDIEREAVIVSTGGYEQGRFLARFDVHLKADKGSKTLASKVKLTAEETAHYLREEKKIQITNPVISNITEQLGSRPSTKTELLASIFDYCSENILRGGEDTPSEALGALEQGVGTTLGRARAMVALCRASKIPARLVTGFVLKPSPDAQAQYWLEALSKKSWLPYDPENGFAGELPVCFLPVRRDGAEIVRTPKDFIHWPKYAVRQLQPPPFLVALPKNQFWRVIDLTRLPPSMQNIITLILLLPFGALITAIFRNLVGVQTFGTFTPSLIALSFVQADWRTGALVFVVVLTIGILARLLLNSLKLLMVARLSIILTLVVLCMILGVSILDFLNLTPSVSAVLLPMVILTMMIERFNIISEEDGHQQALKVFAGTIVVAVCCLFVLTIEELSTLVLAFPEIHLFSIAALFLIGRYSGYRLTELWRFRDMRLS